MQSSREFVISSMLNAEASVIWRHAVTPSGVNREFRPLARMTFPPDLEDITQVWKPGEPLFRSWVLLAGFVPVEYDDLVLIEVDPGQRFLERSSLFSQKVWEHERIVEALAEGTRVTDRVRFTPRLPLLVGVQRFVFRTLFRWRHRQLRRLFGTVAGEGR